MHFFLTDYCHLPVRHLKPLSPIAKTYCSSVHFCQYMLGNQSDRKHLWKYSHQYSFPYAETSPVITHEHFYLILQWSDSLIPYSSFFPPHNKFSYILHLVPTYSPIIIFKFHYWHSSYFRCDFTLFICPHNDFHLDMPAPFLHSFYHLRKLLSPISSIFFLEC